MKVLGRVGNAAAALPWLLPPSTAKNKLLNRLGHEVDSTARIAPAIVLRVGHVKIGAGVRIGPGNVIKDLTRLEMGAESVIGGWNTISSSPVLIEHLKDSGQLLIGPSAGLTSRHTLDCSGSIVLEPFSLVAGHGSEILTHSVDLARNVQSAHRIVVGDHSFIGTRCVLLGGVQIPPRSVVAAGAVLTATEFTEGSLIAGIPAKSKTSITGAWFERETETTNTIYDPLTGVTTPHAF